MCSNILLLLAVYCVVVSGVKVDVHVKDVNSGYTTLEFRDAGKKIKTFTLSTNPTDAGNIQVKTGGKIEETGLELEFVPKAAAILPVSGHPAIDVKKESECSAGDSCFEVLDKTYYIHVEDVGVMYDEMTCAPGAPIPLKHTPDPENGKILVVDGTIHEVEYPLLGKPQNCVISVKAPSGGGVVEDNKPITINLSDDNCASDKKKCLKQNEPTIKLHVTGVCKLQKKIVFTSTLPADTQEFTLEVGGTTDDKIIKVTEQGVIAETKLLLTLEPTECEVKGFTELPWIPLIESAECGAGSQNCFKNKAPTPTTTTTASDNAFRLSLFFICAILGYML